MTISVGEVIAVVGVEIEIRAFENSNVETHFFNGDKYNGISIREFVSIEHGFRQIICVIEGEYLDEKTADKSGPQPKYIRKLKAKPIGYFEDGEFRDGIKFLPKIGDKAHLLSESSVGSIFDGDTNSQFVIGKLLKEELDVSLPWQKVFNSHLGIFGNTGSGKSNTLTKLFTVLFENKIEKVAQRSKFVFLDFNGEYTGEQLTGEEHKSVIRLSTRTGEADKFMLTEDEFWDAETLGILFHATTNTQKPFLRRIVEGRKTYEAEADGLSDFAKAMFAKTLRSEHPNPEALELLKSLSTHLDLSAELKSAIHNVGYHRNNSAFYYHGNYFNVDDATYNAFFRELVDAIDFAEINGFRELQVRAELKLISDLLYGSVQYEHIQPLMRRIDAMMTDFSKVLGVANDDHVDNTVTVISLRECKQDIKKTIPILIAKHYYELHKTSVQSPPNKTMHIVIDEAHNILSQQSNREAESWKDYRLELFEEIIKEGRKFGIYITISSQRPADISPTIVSQLHNYFIHRLVNDRDLALLENTISTLDRISRGQIPNLPQGACVVTGTTFDVPMLLQIDKLPKHQEPDSSDVNLEELWH
ncbi:ATP-binding protein [Shimia abyssi]|uniref:Helicase HerA central domain-containing protein n=1 Tax=Shimia abyssi TaxID=1662395 RepID=A0A2P8FFQ9_9RHOB|nr:ATP-binding protein [Shimia abyssi]PSL20528.1 hypothetical protein CLV88_103175 [Shimia abyssi]